ncbi:metal ABC transporter solute-binding protein, Zn/Mn family [Ilumatobacter sp.]|uniref:metal ABC transporter solute-binding protein, Zn/Mn family n=1 Tax=Ilumatobacter sp. TaxID=1967498 RepID=UPI003C514F53
MRSFQRTCTLIAGSAVGVVSLAACGSDSATTEASDGAGDVPTVVVTTNILGDVVQAAAGDLVDVEVIMPAGAEPHDFAPSARQAEAMENADLLVINGAGFEAGMVGIVDNVESAGTPVFSFADSVSLLDGDPHLWTDPHRIDEGLDALETRLGELDEIEPDQLADSFDAYRAELDALDTSIEASVETIPVDRRVLVTNHEVFEYFADRYGFDVVGAVIPSTTTSAEPSASDIEALADLIRDDGIPAIFGETTQSTQIANAIADEVGTIDGDDVVIVELFSESLGDADSGAATYLEMMQTNADLIADALR